VAILFEFALILPDALRRLSDGLQQGSESRLEFLRQILGYLLLVEATR
jgi:hypothetical protein